MAEYIEREAVMQKFADHVKRSNNSDFAPVPTWNQAVQIVEDSPAADVRPAVRGKWISGDARNVTAVCSNCGRLRLGNGAESATKYAPFCEKCGAYMREES